jgi:hypothetical protein
VGGICCCPLPAARARAEEASKNGEMLDWAKTGIRRVISPICYTTSACHHCPLDRLSCTTQKSTMKRKSLIGPCILRRWLTGGLGRQWPPACSSSGQAHSRGSSGRTWPPCAHLQPCSELACIRNPARGALSADVQGQTFLVHAKPTSLMSKGETSWYLQSLLYSK